MSAPFDPLPFLKESGVSALDASSSVVAVTQALRSYTQHLNGTRGLNLEATRVMALRELKAHKVRDGRALVLAAFAELAARNMAAGAEQPTEPEPWPEPVEGGVVLDELVSLFTGYMVLP